MKRSTNSLRLCEEALWRLETTSRYFSQKVRICLKSYRLRTETERMCTQPLTFAPPKKGDSKDD